MRWPYISKFIRNILQPVNQWLIPQTIGQISHSIDLSSGTACDEVTVCEIRCSGAVLLPRWTDKQRQGPCESSPSFFPCLGFGNETTTFYFSYLNIFSYWHVQRLSTQCSSKNCCSNSLNEYCAPRSLPRFVIRLLRGSCSSMVFTCGGVALRN